MPFFRKPNKIELSQRLVSKLEREYKSHWQNYLRLANNCYSQFRDKRFEETYNKKNPNHCNSSAVKSIQYAINNIPNALATMITYKERLEESNQTQTSLNTSGITQDTEVTQKHKDSAKKLLEISKLFHEKNNFSWNNLNIMKEEINIFALQAEAARLTYKMRLLRLAKEINSQLNSDNPNLQSVGKIISEIRDLESESISTQSGSELTYKWTLFTGGNIFMRLLFGFVEGIASILCVAVAIAALIPMSILGSPYFGTLYFLKDTVQWCVESIATLVKAILFPIDMLYSYLTTGSACVLCGESYLILNELSYLCDQTLPDSTVPLGNYFK